MKRHLKNKIKLTLFLLLVILPGSVKVSANQPPVEGRWDTIKTRSLVSTPPEVSTNDNSAASNKENATYQWYTPIASFFRFILSI